MDWNNYSGVINYGEREINAIKSYNNLARQTVKNEKGLAFSE